MLIVETTRWICFQETHLRVGEKKYLKMIFRDLIYHVSTFSRSTGIVIGASKWLPWKSESLDAEPDGWFLIL